MLICDNGLIREMTPEEEYVAEHLPNPEEQISVEDALNILTGEENDQFRNI